TEQASLRPVTRSPAAWLLCGYFGLVIVGYYVWTAWLPDILADRGVTVGSAATALAFAIVAGAVSSTAVPLVATRIRSHARFAAALVAVQVISVLGLLVSRGFLACLFGVLFLTAIGGAFALTFVLFNTQTTTAQGSASLSSMVQSIGYPLGALGP